MEKLFNILCILFVSQFFGSIQAQDNHFWAQQFGGQATLLGGAVVGGFEDNSAMYYNPGAFAFVNEVNHSINTNLYKYEEVMLRDGAGKDLDVFSRRFSLLPQMMSGLITHKPESPVKLGFIMLTRHHDNIDFNQRNDMFYDVVPDNPGDEYYIGSIDIQNIMTETWAGMSLSFRISEKLGFGLTGFASYRNQRYLYLLSSFTSMQDSLGKNSNASFRYSDAVRVNTIRLFMKGGLHWRPGKWRLGIAAITPSLGLWGESRVLRELSYLGLPGQPDVTYNDQQKQIPSEYKHPFAVSIGANRLFKKGSIGFSAEYFGNVDLYRMVKAEIRDVAYPSSASTGPVDFLGFQNYSDQVLNVALGAEWQLTERFSLSGSLRTDFTSQRRFPHEVRTSVLEKPLLTVPVMDLYHLASGFTLKRPNSLLAFGGTFTYGFIEDAKQLVNFTNPSFPDAILGTPEAVSQISNWSLALMLGYTYFFALK